MRRRLLAIVALLAAAATIALAVAVAVGEFPRGPPCWPVADCRHGRLVRRAAARAGAGRRADRCRPLGSRARWFCWLPGGAAGRSVGRGLLVSLATARAAFTVHVDLPSASAPRQPVLVYNPKSGGGKRSASRWSRRLAGVGSRRSSSGAVTTSRRWSAPQSRGAPTGWPWPVGTARRPSSPPSPRS